MMDQISQKTPMAVIDIGHSERDKGAISPFPPFTTEWDYNSRMADVVQNYVSESSTIIVTREPVIDGYQRLPARINSLEPDFILSLHCNAATAAAFGTEMIYHPGSIDGRRFAEILQREISEVFGWTVNEKGYRGAKTPIGGRGSSLLEKTAAPCVIAEPFFLSNEHDHQRGLELFDELAMAYARAIDDFSRFLFPD
jgi:N-acetylmuramoyl-L-alanine amidase